MTSLNKYYLSLDLDWPPDASLELVRSLLAASNVTATLFATHKPDVIQDLMSDGHEVGLHPNFLNGTTHGKTQSKLFLAYWTFSPRTKSLERTHSSNLVRFFMRS